ncbi:signal peptidase I [Patescibacteria group bacterium]|nr:signal peptidase I [Patescibacteria group bacterium]
MQEQKSSVWSVLVDIIETIVVAAAIFVVVYLFLLQPHQVKGASMESDLSDNDYILTDKISYRFGDPKRGDIIIFKSPTNPDVDFIKRIVALPGEEIEINNRNIIIYNSEKPNGYKLNEPYDVLGPTTGGSYIREGQKIEVPADNYIVLGDNRTHSFDSREWGPLPKKSIIGRAWLRYWPIPSFSFIEREDFASELP